MDWLEVFVDQCLQMIQKNEKKRSLRLRGTIIRLDEDECPKCGNKPIFSGRELESGHFYECGDAKWCPSCKQCFDVYAVVNFAAYHQERFLTVMKTKVVEQTALKEYDGSGSLTIKEHGCPVCHSDTWVYTKDLGAIDYYDNTWEVCSNIDCTWPGTHEEHYETGPY